MADPFIAFREEDDDDYYRALNAPDEYIPGWFPVIWGLNGREQVAHWVEETRYRSSYCGMAVAFNMRPPIERFDHLVRRCSRCVEMLNTQRRYSGKVDG
jgi:hypothetical protein